MRVSICCEEKCTACMACANACPKGAIDIGINKYGYEKVVIDNGKCVDCGLCAKVCARRMQIERHSPIKCYAGQSRDSEKLKHSASGAAFQMLAEIVLEMGGVCYGCAGKMINGEYSAYHVRVTNVDELQSILNSKYILSHIGTTYQQIKEDLKNGKLVLFGGTPCQALGLKSFLNNEYENLIVVDVICHGVTSKTIFNDYLREVEKEQNIVITDYIFRDKKAGWGSNFCYSYYDNGDKNKIKIKRFPKEGASHEIHYLRGDISRENCFSCEMSNTNRVSDFTFGDYWAIEIEHPEFIVRKDPALSIRKGINCMMVNTEKGMQYLSKLQEKMVMYEVDLASITRHNSNLLKPSKRGKARDAVLENYYMEGYKKIEENYNDTVGKKRTVYAAKNMIKTHIPDKLRVQIKRYAADENMKLIVTSPSNYTLFLNENPIFPTVEKWLGLYKNANCIFTNTYHGMLFCIIFKKQFLFFVQKGSGAAENDRFYSLMSMLHLEDRMVTSGDTACISEKMKRPIDYEKVYSVIRSERLRTDAFFEKYGM